MDRNIRRFFTNICLETIPVDNLDVQPLGFKKAATFYLLLNEPSMDGIGSPIS
jgi:hypothetical protein